MAIPDLAPLGLGLMGGRLLPGPRGPAGQLMYETASGGRVTLCLEAGSGRESRFRFAEADGGSALAWRSPELSYALTGPLDRDGLIAVAHVIHAGK